MCLILFSWKTHPKYKLIVAANRDEFYARPTAPADFWPEYPTILAGKDLKAGGTWLGIEKSGYFAAVTNYRDLSSMKENAISRGDLIKNYLLSKNEPERYVKEVAKNKDNYNGFNLLVSDLKELYYYSNKENKSQELDKGIYGLSNHLLNTPWPKVVSGKAQFESLLQDETIAIDPLFKLLQNIDQPEEELLPSTGISKDLERALSSIFIKTGDYGTYCSTVLLVDNDGDCSFEERTYATDTETFVRKYRFDVFL